MHPQLKFLYILRLLADIFVLVLSFFLSVYISLAYSNSAFSSHFVAVFLFLVAVWLLSAQVTKLYSEFRIGGFGTEFTVLLKNIIVQSLGAIVVLFFLKEDRLPRVFIGLYSGSSLVALSVEKYLAKQIFLALRRKGGNLRTVLIVGGGAAADGIVSMLDGNPHLGYKIIGLLNEKRMPSLNGRYLGKVSKLDRILNDRRIDDVFVAMSDPSREKMNEILRVCENHAINVRIIPDYPTFLPANYNISLFDKFLMITIGSDKINELHWRALKRSFDVVFSAAVIIFVMSWLSPLIVIAIKLSSRGPVLFKQERGGRDSKRFTVYKFRSMVSDSQDFDPDGKYQQASTNDTRITKIGKILRCTSLDELPQFINVLKGDMSIVGPRPHPQPLNFESKPIVSQYMRRHLVKPGITGWAQVHGHRGETRKQNQMQQRINYDLWYIENWSFWLDIKIISMTVWQMIKGDGKAY